MSVAYPDVLIVTTSEGHQSIAQAVSETLEDSGISTRIHIQTYPVFALYRLIYRYFPSLMGIFIASTNVPLIRKLMLWNFSQSHARIIQTLLEENRPKVIISTIYVFNPILDKLSKKGFTYNNVVTDPVTFSSMNVSERASHVFVFDEKARSRYQEISPLEPVSCTGWFVQKKWNRDFDQKKVRATLGLQTDMFTLLLTSGSAGMFSIYTVLEELIKKDLSIQVVVSCGSNKHLLQKTEELSKRSYAHIRILPLPFTTHLEDYVKASDIVAGKAGPNMIFECVACGIPYFVLAHVHGQEDGNLSLVRDYKIGWVEENPIQAVNLLENLIQNPTEIAALTPYLKKMVDYNENGKLQLVKVLQQQLKDQFLSNSL